MLKRLVIINSDIYSKADIDLGDCDSLQIVGPVSYTHLDVYKRQLQGFCFYGISKKYNFSQIARDKFGYPKLHLSRVTEFLANYLFKGCLLYTSRCV